MTSTLVAKSSIKNQSLIQFLVPASKRTISILSMVASFVEEYQFCTNWNALEHKGWRLPATQEKHYWCGLWNRIGCLNEELHEKLGKGRRVYVKQFQRCCYRASCKECYTKWIARQANVATRKIEYYSKKTNLKPIHLILCIPPSQFSLPEEKLRERMTGVLKKAQWQGGAVIFHPFRFDKTNRIWYYAPHFHLVGFGYRFQISQAFGKYGWFIKIAEERESVFQTFCYLLSHCGIKKGKHTVTWSGNLSYSKLKLEKVPKITCCPVCGGEFMPIYHDGIHPVVPPDIPYEGLVDSDGDWYTVETKPKSEWTKQDRYDYVLTRELYDANNGISVV